MELEGRKNPHFLDGLKSFMFTEFRNNVFLERWFKTRF